jgi:predicted DNA-binding transcriptional regulator AlpA
MWLYRVLRSKGFPQPVRLNRAADPSQAMRFWAVSDLDAWDEIDKHDGGASS